MSVFIYLGSLFQFPEKDSKLCSYCSYVYISGWNNKWVICGCQESSSIQPYVTTTQALESVIGLESSSW